MPFLSPISFSSATGAQARENVLSCIVTSVKNLHDTGVNTMPQYFRKLEIAIFVRTVPSVRGLSNR